MVFHIENDHEDQQNIFLVDAIVMGLPTGEEEGGKSSKIYGSSRMTNSLTTGPSVS